MTVEVRPRNAWEAIDLGFAMARQWFMPLWMLWWGTALPIGLLLVLFLHDHFWTMALVAWWLKPLYEPPLLFWLSRAVFGEYLSVGAVLRAWPRLVRPRLFANLTWARLAPSRSFHMPVALLEGLRGKPRSKRVALLGRGQQAGFWLTWVGIHFEAVLQMSFLAVIVMLLPDEVHWLDFEDLFKGTAERVHWLEFVGSLLGMSLVAPFYVAGGFALYISRRIDLEAWDIDIAFRRMNRRIEEGSVRRGVGVAALVGALALSGFPASDAAAQTLSSAEAKQAVEEVLANPDFGRFETKTHWEYVGERAETDSSRFGDFLEWLGELAGSFAPLVEALAWTAMAVLVIYVVYQLSREGRWGRRGQGLSRREAAPGVATTLFGLDLSPRSLPDDIAGASLRLLEAGRIRESLSLLYRGMLSRLVNEAQLEIPGSATEGECRRLVRLRRPAEEADFFDGLTEVWIPMAYGHLTPGVEQVEILCSRWRELLEPDHAG